ncbi:hypothetical protein QR98_0026000 [Sarcoptes scabiei]|uniref:Uncharacterized protein n=1 Tax=Sarcoptes scabiei TaxID=52283 RepID=A0A131ZZ68_SARSC|nr:hypothetical protein QR98_0026000 [Sarcoptes scabiei]
MSDVSYYKNILQDQTDLLNSKIDRYNRILKESSTLPEFVIGQIHLVIGQSKLFINERFKQFSGLIDDCEWKRGEKEIKVEDLAGFWDMISYQIDDLKFKFDELRQLESNDWKPIEKQTPTTNDSINSIGRKPLQATNGRRNKTTINHRINLDQNNVVDGQTNRIKTKPIKQPIRSNFREFLRNKAKNEQEKIHSTAANINDRSDLIVIDDDGKKMLSSMKTTDQNSSIVRNHNGQLKNDETTSKNLKTSSSLRSKNDLHSLNRHNNHQNCNNYNNDDDDEDDIQVMIVVNNNQKNFKSLQSTNGDDGHSNRKNVANQEQGVVDGGHDRNDQDCDGKDIDGVLINGNVLDEVRNKNIKIEKNLHHSLHHQKQQQQQQKQQLAVKDSEKENQTIVLSVN